MSNFGPSEIIGIIQIVIGLGAITLAILAYLKVLKQIDISNQQTQLTLDQVDSLNRERRADLKISLLSELNGQIKQILEVKYNYEKVTIDLNNFEILLNADKDKFADVITGIPNLKQAVAEFGNVKVKSANVRLVKLQELYEEIYGKDIKVSALEQTIQETYKNNREIDEITVFLNQILLAMEKLENSARQLN